MPTPVQWLARLEQQLAEQRQHAQLYDTLYSGDRVLEVLEQDYAEVFDVDRFGRSLLEPPYSNVAAIGVDALAERLVVEGFTVGADDDRRGADAADAVWLENDLDVAAPIGHTESLVKGTAAILVWPGADRRAVVSLEDAEQLVLHRMASPPYDIDGALKLYVDEWTGNDVAQLWTAEHGGRFTFTKRETAVRVDGELTRWEVGQLAGGAEAFEALPRELAGRLPIAELANRQRLLRAPASELVHVAPLADVHDKLIADMVIAASFGAIPIRTATGIKLPRDKVTGEPYSPFDVRADRMMVSENPNAKFSTLSAADLAGYVAAIDMVLREIRALTRAPQHYYGDGVSSGMSGETLKAAESSLVRKTDAITPRFGAGWRKGVHYALTIDGSEWARQPIRTRWKNTETIVEAQAVDAATKLDGMGVPLDVTLERIGFPRQLIARAVAGKAAAQLQGQQLVDALKRDAVGAGAGVPTTSAEVVPASAA